MEMDEYSVNEGDGAVEVCAQLMAAPADGLQCSIVATLTPMDGDKAGMSITLICMLLRSLVLFCVVIWGAVCIKIALISLI